MGSENLITFSDPNKHVSNYNCDILCNFFDLPIRLWRQVVHQDIFLKRNGSTTTKQVANVSNKIEKIVPSYVKIGVLLVHIERITIVLLYLKIDGFCQRRVKMRFEVICDSFN